MHLNLHALRQRLPTPATDRYPLGAPFVLGAERDNLRIELFRPAAAGLAEDIQQPHAQDELYVVVQGQSDFEHLDQHRSVNTGDLLHVGAGEAHRFVRFSEDFEVWVIFYGEPQP